MRKAQDYYAVLHIKPTADADEIRKAYKELALRYHPDKNLDNVVEATEMFQLVSQAFSVLKDPAQKELYDQRRGSEHEPPSAKGTCERQGTYESCCSKSDSGDSLNATKSFQSSYNASFGLDHARGLFHEVFGREVAQGLANAIGKAPVFRDTIKHGLSKVTTEAEFHISLRLQAESACRETVEEKRAAVQEFEARCNLEQRERLHKLKMARRSVAKASIAVVFVLLIFIAFVTASTIGADPIFHQDRVFLSVADVLVLVFFVCLTFVMLWRTVSSLRLVRRLTRDSDGIDDRNAVAADTLRRGMYRAEQKLEVAQRELASARDTAKQAKRKVASVERDGASLHDAMQLGQHLWDRLIG
uniref:J domain-containing protein n=1 Tax=Noctiluca scintillans TaxID=2966 RepID=A0A7S0ZND7_NOCSC|mmetsp:Transcript_12076/g.33239  ORF Transcript_12076/g.33239 Transcript_12076/m.33239 type:complete len:359 (+) Transcript_12076:97-1173(+)